MSRLDSDVKQDLISTGIEGLDQILGGGLTRNRLYLLEGEPGSGKTTLSLQFLLDGAKRGESGIFVSLSETTEELHTIAASHGWSLDGIRIFEMLASSEASESDSQYTMFHPSEVELTETTRAVMAEAERERPARLVFDSVSELRLLAQTPLRYRRQILALKQYFSRHQCTVLMVDTRTPQENYEHVHTIAHGVISLEKQSLDYGVTRRRLQVSKMRGRPVREGYHDFRIRTGGLEVYPRLVAAEHSKPFERDPVPSGIAALDQLLGGGLSRGSSTLIMGPAGTGKSTIASQYVTAAAQRGESSLIFLFDESVENYLHRSAGLGMELGPLVESGQVLLRRVDPSEMAPGELTQTVRREVEQHGRRLVVIDSLNGYHNAMPDERMLAIHLHEMLTFLGQVGVTTLLVMAQHGLVGADIHGPVETSYLADTVILLRYFEVAGEVHKAISVIKKRTGQHERLVRQLGLGSKGVRVGKPLREFQGVLTGAPVYLRESLPSLADDE